jgi:hypothetical protein
MKIELRKISFNERMSEETNCFVADLYINGKKVGYCKNEGHGGCTDYRGNTKEDNVLIAEAEKYFKSLPKVKVEGLNFMLQPTLENAIDEQLEEYLKAKERKKFEKYMVDAILFGVPNGHSYTRIKFRVPLSKINPLALQQKVNEIKKTECTNGVQILNTNLEALGINI